MAAARAQRTTARRHGRSWFGLVVAAGSGRRFGGLKQFCEVHGSPLLLHALRPFERCAAVTGYVVVTNADRIARVRAMARARCLRKILAILPGGAERGDSVANGLATLPARGYVAVHDAARPFLTAPMLVAGFTAAERHRAAVFATPLTDTVKRVRSGRIVSTVDRSDLVAAQTPQIFSIPLLRRAYAAARRHGVQTTDDAALVELLGVRPVILEGPRLNLKVTDREDIRLCRALL